MSTLFGWLGLFLLGVVSGAFELPPYVDVLVVLVLVVLVLFVLWLMVRRRQGETYTGPDDEDIGGVPLSCFNPDGVCPCARKGQCRSWGDYAAIRSGMVLVDDPADPDGPHEVDPEARRRMLEAPLPQTCRWTVSPPISSTEHYELDVDYANGTAELVHLDGEERNVVGTGTGTVTFHDGEPVANICGCPHDVAVVEGEPLRDDEIPF